MTELKPFMVSYRHNGDDWGVQIHAEDIEDARRRVRSIGANGQPYEVFASFETRVPPSVLMPLLTLHAWIVNAWVKLTGRTKP